MSWRWVLLFCLILPFSVVAATPSSPEPAASTPLVVVTDDNYPPYIFRDPNGKLEGYLVDAWALWERKSHRPVRLVGSNWAQALRTIELGQADVIDTIFQTADREAKFDFAPPYADIPVPIYVHMSIGGISNPASLPGFLVGVKAGDACIDRLKEVGPISFKLFDSYEALIGDAVEQKIKIFCMDEPPADYLLYRADANRNFYKAFILYKGQFHRAVRKGQAGLLESIQSGFNAVTDVELKDLHNKWFGSRIELPPYVRYIGYGLFVTAVIGGLLAVWVLLLRHEVRRRTAELNRQRSHLRALFNSIPDLIWLKDPEGIYLACNPEFERFFGAAEADIVGKTDYDFIDKTLADFFRQKDREAMLAGKSSVNEEQLSYACDGHQTIVETIKTPMFNAAGGLVGILGIARDITERKAAEKQIESLAHYDSLTGLPNRRLFLNRLDRALAWRRRTKHEGALLLIDLDNFKTLNDTFGHEVGDLLLRQVADRISACANDGDTVARLGGDEFAVMLEDLGETVEEAAARVIALSDKISAALSQHYIISSQEHRCTASIGAALFGENFDAANELLKRVEIAMYQAKAGGRNTMRFFDPDLQVAVQQRVALEKDLRQGIAEGQLLLHYQPQVVSDGRIVGAEALVRWRHPERGLVSPAEFIPLAEESGLILPLGEWVLETACNQIVAWSARPETAHLTLAVNVSARQFGLADFVGRVLALVERTGADPRRLKLELTESMLADNLDDIIEKMSALKAVGASFSLDDFGTGYSSLSYLKRLPLDQLKIDQSFVRDVLTDPNDAAIARTIVALSESLGLSVIAEGVETAEQRDFLARSGCHAYQGYFFSRPLPLEAFEDLVRQGLFGLTEPA